jgi:hypothetical protein
MSQPIFSAQSNLKGARSFDNVRTLPRLGRLQDLARAAIPVRSCPPPWLHKPMNFAASSRVTSNTWGPPVGLIGCASSRLKSSAFAMSHTQKVMADPKLSAHNPAHQRMSEPTGARALFLEAQRVDTEPIYSKSRRRTRQSAAFLPVSLRAPNKPLLERIVNPLG